MQYTVVLEKNEEGGYTVTVPALKGCITEGDTIAESLSRAKEAIECHVEALMLLGKRVPSDGRMVRLDTESLSEVLISKVTVAPTVEAEPRARVKVA